MIILPSSLLGEVLIAVPSAKFPVSIPREFEANALGLLDDSQAKVPLRASNAKISLYFPVKQGTWVRRQVRR